MLIHPDTIYPIYRQPADYQRSMQAARRYALREALRERRARSRSGRPRVVGLFSRPAV